VTTAPVNAMTVGCTVRSSGEYENFNISLAVTPLELKVTSRERPLPNRGTRTRAEVDDTKEQDSAPIPPTLTMHGLTKLLPDTVTKESGFDMDGIMPLMLFRYESRSAEVRVLLGVKHLNVRVRVSEVPTPPVGMFNVIKVVDATDNTDAVNVPTVMPIFTVEHVKSEPATVILSPGARTRGDTLEIVCAKLK
jgi:hypothetical protein